MTTMTRHLARSLGACALFFAAATTHAQPRADGFALNRFEPAERPSEWFALESLDLRGHKRFAAGMVIDYANRPLVLYLPEGGTDANVVKHQFFAHVGGTITLWDRARFAISQPIALFQDGEPGQTSTSSFRSGNATTIGDLRVGGDVRFIGVYGDPITFAGGVQLFLPTGSQDSFTGDGNVRLLPRLMVAGDIDWFVYAAQMGFNFRANDDPFGGAARGSEVSFAGSAGIRTLDGRLIAGPEIFGNTVVTDSDAFFSTRATPFEILFGTHYWANQEWIVGAAIGPGLTRAFGTPKLRVVASVAWVQPLETEAPPPADKPPPVEGPSDRDGDGIFDDVDACPDEPGVPNDDPKKHGCPPPGDRDGDGILDDVDACPDVPGISNEDPAKHGCPPPDRDGDGILDEVDACPDEPGVATDDPKTNGCPPPKDRDGDGILDEKDACPDSPGPANDDPKKHGCPVARIEKGQIKIREQVQFAYNSSRILKASDFILEAVAKIFKDNPQIKRVEIQGHTDSKGSNNYNKALSNRRARSVFNWLVLHGIDRKRLTSRGLGEESPIDSNDTDEGRQNNRRVEFHILEQDKVVEEVIDPKAKADPKAEAPKTEAPKAEEPKP